MGVNFTNAAKVIKASNTAKVIKALYKHACNQEFFRVGEVSCNRDSSTKVSRYNRKALQGKKGVFLSKILLKLHLNENLTHKWTQTSHSFSKIRARSYPEEISVP